MKAVTVVLSLVLAGCATKKGAPVVAFADLGSSALPSECTIRDQAWVNLPDGDVRRSDAARNYRLNKSQYRRLIKRRAVCRAAIQARASS